MSTVHVLCVTRLEFISDEYSGQLVKTPKFWTANKDLAEHWVSADRDGRAAIEVGQLPDNWQWQ